MSDIKITCLSIDCPERTGGECNATVDPELMVELFLRESNAIEGVYDEDSLKQAKYAWGYLMSQEKLDGGVILKTHKILMLHQKLLPNEKGYWRRCPVWVGGREGLIWRKIPEAISKWVERSNLQLKYPGSRIEADIKQQHIEYEKIHPFVDGNGRTGRMFLNFMRLKANLPLLVIFEDDRFHYYDWFKS